MIQSQEKPGQLKNKKSFCKREGGKKGKKLCTKYLQYFFRNHLPNYFIQIPLAFSPLIGIHLALVRLLHWECHVQFWALQCEEGINILEPVQWRAPVPWSTASEGAGLLQPGEWEAVG